MMKSIYYYYFSIGLTVLIVVLNYGNVCRGERREIDLASNITRLLDKLLTNYSKTVRPNHSSGISMLNISYTYFSFNSLSFLMDK
jgi:hypothetical protein